MDAQVHPLTVAVRNTATVPVTLLPSAPAKVELPLALALLDSVPAAYSPSQPAARPSPKIAPTSRIPITLRLTPRLPL